MMAASATKRISKMIRCMATSTGTRGYRQRLRCAVALSGPPPRQCRGWKAPKRDGDHGSPCPVLVISTQSKKGHAMIPAVFALGLATGIALTPAFALGLLPLLSI